jgi:hypothetical protein
MARAPMYGLCRLIGDPFGGEVDVPRGVREQQMHVSHVDRGGCDAQPTV